MIIDTRDCANEDERAQRVATALAAKAFIVRIAAGARNVAAIVACPFCAGGRLKYSIAPNGHIWAGCSTKGCARFVE